MFVASTILIHGLATGLSWGLFSWSVVVGILSIPELIFVMIMTTQHWVRVGLVFGLETIIYFTLKSIFFVQGLQSVHGLTEIISYLVRLIINCMALMCVIPTGLRWRRERQIMSQLENLANRMNMASPESLRSVMAAPAALARINESMRRKSASRKRRLSQSSGHDNPAFVPITPNQSNGQTKNRQPQITLPIFPYYYGMYPSQNEFNASIFGMDPNQYIGPQSLINRKET